MRRKSTVSGMSHLQYDERSMQHQESCICSTRRRLCSVKCTVSENLICSRKTGCVVREESLQYQECNICNTLRASVQHQEKFVHCEENIVQCEEKVYSNRRVHFQEEDSLCGWKRKSAVLGISHLKCAGKSMHYRKGCICSLRQRLSNISGATSPIESQCVWCEEKLCSIWKVTSVV